MTTAPTPSRTEELAQWLEQDWDAMGVPELLDVAKELRRLQASYQALQTENERLRMELVAEASAAAEQKLRADQLAQQHRMQAQMHAQATQQLAGLEARKPLPLSYRAGAMTSSVDGGATVSLHFNDMAEAEAWFVAITDQYDTGLVDKSPNLQEPLVDKTANLQDRPVSLIASREVVADGPVHVTRLHLTEEGRAGLTSKATGPLPGITGGSS